MKYIIAITAALAIATAANAELIPITNASFEEPAQDPGGWTNDLPGWTQLPASGDAFIEYIVDFVADGVNHLGMAEGAEVYQDLGVSLLPDTIYTLTVNAGNRNDAFTPDSGQESRFGLYLGNSAADGGTLLADGVFDAGTIDDGTFSDDLSLSWTSGGSVDAGNLFVSLRSTGAGRAHFDNIRVDAVPEPASCLLAGLACLGLLQLRRRR